MKENCSRFKKAASLNIDEETYIKIISDKTGSLFSACTDIGAASTTQDPEKRNLLKAYGENVGLAFQIRDDLLDYLGRKSILGKSTGSDIKEKKLTLPLIYALQNSNRHEATQALRYIKKGARQKEIAWVLDFVRANGGIEYSSRKAEEFAALASNSLISFPDSPVKQSLLQFVDFVMERSS